MLNDNPQQTESLTGLTQLSIGTDPAFGPPQPESFTTYLMYKPTVGGVWVALAKLNWNWSIAITNPPVTEVGEGFYYDPQGTTVYDEWPEWTGTTKQMLSQGWQ